MSRRHVHKRTVNFADCDPARIVFYPRFYEWFDRATEMMFRAVGLHWEEMIGAETPAGIFNGMPLVETSAKYNFPCRFGDELEIESWVDEVKGRTFLVRHDIRNGGKVAVEGRELRVWAVRDDERPAGIRAVPIPEDILDRVRAPAAD